MSRSVLGRGERMRSVAWLVALAAVSMAWLAMTASPASAALAPNQVAPTLRADGQTLRWNQVSNVTSYALATKIPGLPTSYRTVTGTSTTPPVTAGTCCTAARSVTMVIAVLLVIS